MSATGEILDQHGEMRNVRAREEPAWRELASLLRPDEQDFNSAADTPRDDGEIYDATPLYALDDFTGGIFGQLVNPANRWFELSVDDDPELTKWRPVKEWLYYVANLQYSSLSPAASNFYQRAPTIIANIGAFGWGTGYQEEDVGRGRITDLALPIGEIFLARDAAGNYDRVHREFVLTGAQAKRKFKRDLGPNVRDDGRYVFVHAVYENANWQPGGYGRRGFPFHSCYVSPDVRDFRIEGGYHELPYNIGTWSERSRSPYATGPGHNQKPDALMLQEMERTGLIGAQYDAEPMLLLRDEDVLSAADISPNALLYGGVTEKGQALAQYLERKQRTTIPEAKAEQRRAAIKAAFRYGLMQLVNRPQMTAAEFLGWKEAGLELMAHNLVRLQTTWLSPFITRRYRILERAGQVPPPPPELARRRVGIEYVSPLARLLKVQKGRSVMQAQQAIESMAVTDPNIRDWFNGDAAVQHVTDAFTDVPDLLRDPREVEEMRRMKAQQAAQQVDLANTGQAVEIAATASHAEQAATLAKARLRAA